MLENEMIQYRGFHNIVENGEVTGFQVCLRQCVYRGTWLSQFRFGALIVDGVEYGPDDCTFTVSGIEYKYEEMAPLWRVKWPLNEVMVVKVKKPGGLAQGVHTVDVRTGQIRSYLPPRIDATLTAPRDPNARFDMRGMSNERQLIIV
ncbi:MAG: D-mannonate dehydratase [Oscillospiraceae bacterium]|nr:D-mannonate dehydratase [Oscillospiraceae bacterium]